MTKTHLFIRIIGSFFLIGIIVYSLLVNCLPLTIPPLASSLIIRDMHDAEIGEIIADERIRHREMGFDEIPTLYLSGLIWLEDRSFWDNNGVSLRGIARSIIHNLEAGRIVEGASTLSAQYIRNALWINQERDFTHKILESLYALRLNHMMSKKAIVTAYVNRIGFGSLNYGLRSASLYYFSKEPRNLTPAEQIALLVIPKNPNTYDPSLHPKAFRDRYRTIISLLEAGEIITPAEANRIREEPLTFVHIHRPALPYVVDFLKGTLQNGTSSTLNPLRTTIDIALTKRIDTLAHALLDDLSWRNVSDYGILIAERTPTGPVLRVMIGGKNYHESSEGQVNTTLSLRQPGSTIKPFTYLLAFSQLGLTPDSTITDLPVQYQTAEGYAYAPKNYSQSFQGQVTLRQALSQSINVPAIKILEDLGVQTLLGFLRSVGIASLSASSDHYGLALTLGDGEVTLYELLQAYSIFPYHGVYCPIRFIENTSKPCVRKVDQKYSDMVTSILSDRYVKLPEFPLNSALDFPDRWVAWKTGTSRNFRDNWTIGFTEHYMIGVWTGNKNGENMKGVSGASGAGEIFAKIVYALEPTESTPSITESHRDPSSFLEITSPLGGSLYRLESSRSGFLQKIALRFQTNMTYDKYTWLIDGKVSVTSSLTITPGMHTLEILLEKSGKEVSRKSTTFQVNQAD